MGILSKLFGTDPDSVYKTFIKIYEKAKRKRPGKTERDYLKMVLLTKPPYDYQHDTVIDVLLEKFLTIEELAEYISEDVDPENQEGQKNLWEWRKRNIKFSPIVKKRNEDFFREFWG